MKPPETRRDTYIKGLAAGGGREEEDSFVQAPDMCPRLNAGTNASAEVGTRGRSRGASIVWGKQGEVVLYSKISMCLLTNYFVLSLASKMNIFYYNSLEWVGVGKGLKKF